MMSLIAEVIILIVVTVITTGCAVCAGIAMAILMEEMFDE